MLTLSALRHPDGHVTVTMRHWDLRRQGDHCVWERTTRMESLERGDSRDAALLVLLAMTDAMLEGRDLLGDPQ